MSTHSFGLTVSRRAGLTTRVADGDLLVLDASSNEVSSLTGPAAAVWRALDEQATIGSLETVTQLSEDEIAAAVTELSNAGLVELGGFDRRRFLQRSALVGAGAIGSVVVMQLPAAAATTSPGNPNVYSLYSAVNGTGLSGNTSGQYSFYYTAQPTTPTAVSYSISASPFTKDANPSTATNGIVAMSYFTSSTKPRFDDTGTGSDYAAVGPVNSNYPDLTPGEAVVGINKVSGTSNQHIPVIAFTVPALSSNPSANTVSLVLSGSFDGGTQSASTSGDHPPLTTTLVQFVNGTGGVTQSYSPGSSNPNASVPFSVSFGNVAVNSIVYVFLSDTSGTYVLLDLALAATVSAATS